MESVTISLACSRAELSDSCERRINASEEEWSGLMASMKPSLLTSTTPWLCICYFNEDSFIGGVVLVVMNRTYNLIGPVCTTAGK